MRARAASARARAARAKKIHQSSNDIINIILVGLGDFGQTPGPSSVLFGRAAAGAAAAFLCHYYLLRT